jgi:hypothetical protein
VTQTGTWTGTGTETGTWTRTRTWDIDMKMDMDKDTDTTICIGHFFYIGYRTTSILGLSDTGVDFNIDIVTGPTWEQDSDNVFSYIGLKNPISDLGYCRHNVHWRWPLCVEHTVNYHIQILSAPTLQRKLYNYRSTFKSVCTY